MGYFGGLGAGKGWHKFQFLLTAEELEQVLTQLSCLLMVTNSRVPVDYSGTEISGYIAQYRSRLADVTAETYPVDLHISLMLSGTAFAWEPIQARRKRDEGYKLIDLEEPVVNIAPVLALWGSDGRLHFDCLNAPAWMGLEMQFPRVVSYRREGFENLHETSGCRNAALFDSLCAAIKEITKPAVFATPLGERKTRIRTSITATRQLQDHPGLIQQGLRLLVR